MGNAGYRTEVSRERRRFVRVRPHPHRPIEVQVVGNDFMDVFFAQDISVGGMAVSVPHRFEGCEINAEVMLIVSLPGAKAFRAKGQIRHVASRADGDVFGLQFTAIAPEAHEQVRAYVEARQLMQAVV